MQTNDIESILGRLGSDARITEVVIFDPKTNTELRIKRLTWQGEFK